MRRTLGHAEIERKRVACCNFGEEFVMRFESLAGKVAIVSGASRGLGRVYAIALAEAGAKVVALARTLEGDPDKPGNLAELAATVRAA